MKKVEREKKGVVASRCLCIIIYHIVYSSPSLFPSPPLSFLLPLPLPLSLPFSLPPLQMAGAAVKKATETLVKSAQQAIVNVQDDEPIMKTRVKGKVMEGFRQELELKEEIARRQRELQKAEEKLTKIRRERAGH